MSAVRAAVVGHVEWIEFVPVERVPRAGEIVGATESWQQAGGGGSVAAIQLSLLADSVLFLTVLGARRARTACVRGARRARGRGARLVRRRSAAQGAGVRRRDGRADDHDRSGRSSGRAGHDDSLPWHELARCDAVYFCAGDVDALRRGAARAGARRDGARARTLRRAAVELDVLVCERQGRRGGLPSGRPRSRAEARGHDLGRARRLGATRAGRSPRRRCRSRLPTPTVRATASPRASCSRSRPGSRRRKRSRSPRAAAPARSPAAASTPRPCLSRTPRPCGEEVTESWP